MRQTSEPSAAHHPRRWPRRVAFSLASLLVLLVAARVALPYVIEKLVNDRLASIPEYTGRVADIDLELFRGAYKLIGVGIYRQTGEVREPFFLCREIDFSLAWRELVRGRLVSDIHVDRGQVQFVAAPTEEQSQNDVDRRWQDVINDLFPIHITHFVLTNGFVRYVDKTKQPHVDIFIRNMEAVATGLRNRPAKAGGELPASIKVEGETVGGGKVNLFVKADPLAPQPHFDLSVKVDNLDLTALNDSLQAIANVDVSRGTFQLAAEMAGRDGGFQGYVKPFFENLDFNNLEDKEEGILSRIWENIVAGVAWLVKNKSRDQVATRIPFQGQFGDPQVGLWATIRNLFRHGFVRAFSPTVEGSIDPQNVLATGESKNGRPIAAPPDEPAKAEPRQPGASGKAGAPTGR